MSIGQLQRAAALFFNHPYTFTAIGSSSGYSGSHLAQVIDAKGTVWCVRLWRDEPLEALRFIHRALLESNANGCESVPRLAKTREGETLVAVEMHWAEAQSWIDGAPLHRPLQSLSTERTPNTGYNVSLVARQQIATALATFHASTAGLQPHNLLELDAISHLWLPTLRTVDDSLPRLQHRYRGQKHLWSADAQATVDSWFSMLTPLALALQKRLASLKLSLTLTATACHCDLWPDHVYFVDDQFSGFVDFGALAYTTPVIDLVHLILHFGSWQTDDAVLSTYSAICQLSEQDRLLLPILAACDLINEGCWAIQELQNSSLPILERRAHWHNLRFLSPSIEYVTYDLNRR